MKIKTFLTNLFMRSDKYRTHPEAVIVACYFNPEKSAYRRKAFDRFYNDIKHLNHRIVECAIGDADFELPVSESITRVRTKSLLWHKESLLNKAIKELPAEFKYVFWVDTDVIFTNVEWVLDGVKSLQHFNIIQPFRQCYHLEKDEVEPSWQKIDYSSKTSPKRWFSFGATCSMHPIMASSENYDRHGHVGFAWGARREVLDQMPLYDRALIGGADHIIAHAAAGHIPHSCITKCFSDDIEAVEEWMRKFYKVIDGKVGFCNGDLYHLWHGDIANRQYLKRMQDFTRKSREIVEQDDNGLYVGDDSSDTYMRQYFLIRDAVSPVENIADVMNAADSEFSGGKTGGGGVGGLWEVIDTQPIEEARPVVEAQPVVEAAAFEHVTNDNGWPETSTNMS